MQQLFPCHNCGAPNYLGQAFCSNCGVRLQYSCPYCNAFVYSTFQVCPYCQGRLSWGWKTEQPQVRQEKYAPPKAKRSSGKILLVTLVVIMLGVGGFAFWQSGSETDGIPPTISNIQVSSKTDTSVVINWVTDEISTSQVLLCDPGDTCTWTDPDDNLVKNHSITIKKLIPGTMYHFTVKSVDPSGNEAISGSENTFLTNKEGTITPPTIPTGIEVGEQAPDFTLINLANESVRLSDFRGKIVMLNFWSTTCGPCAEEMPYIQSVFDNTAYDVVILTVNTEDDHAVAQSWMDTKGYTFPVLLDSTGQVGDEYEASTIPKTFFIDTEGTIVHSEVGRFHSISEITAILDSLKS